VRGTDEVLRPIGVRGQTPYGKFEGDPQKLTTFYRAACNADAV